MKTMRKICAAAVLMVLSVAAGYAEAPEDFQIPVLLSNGEVMMQPCCVMVDGECVALVDSEKTAEKVMNQIKSEYKNEKTVDVWIREKTSVEDLGLENGDEKPEILSGDEAKEQLLNEETVTVETKEVVVEGVTVEYETITNESEDLTPGETQIIQQGSDGFALETNEIIKENGETISTEITERRILKEAVPEIIMEGSYALASPLDYTRLTSGFGQRWGRQHMGVDFGMTEGSSIYAAKSGTVTCAASCGTYGNLVKIDHGGGMETYYAHCSQLFVKEGQQVETGDLIAAVGSTGNSTGPHLHFEVRINGEAKDPLAWLTTE